jgi:DNA-binding transcriptional ArsR family regulator
MGVTKTEYYTKDQIDLAAVLKVLGHPARIAILQSIIKTNACICGDLVTEIGLAQATISQHLKELKSAGLIKGTVEGKKMCYCIDLKNWNKVKKEMNQLLDSTNCVDDCC